MRAFILFLISILFTSIHTVEVNETIEKPLFSLNTIYNQTDYDNFENNVFIIQAFNYILTGSYSGVTETSDALDKNSLASLLEGGLNNFLSQILLPDNRDQFLDIADILTLLEKNGTGGVEFGRIRKYLTYSNAISAIGFALSLDQSAINDRFQEYLQTEFLGGLRENSTCKLHSSLWFKEIANLKFWAIQMLDSTAKIPPGLLNANINWLGNYKECNSIYFDNYTTVPAIQGRYCRANITFPVDQIALDLPIPSGFGLTLGMCFSEACTNEEVESIVNNSLKLIGAFKTATLGNVKCDDTKEVEYPPLTIVFIVFLSLIMVWVGVATLYDIIVRVKEFRKRLFINLDENFNQSEENHEQTSSKPSRNIKKTQESTLHKFLIDSSFYTNTIKTFNTEGDVGGKVKCLNGIRLFSTIWIIFGHTFNYATDRAYFLLLDNAYDLLELSEKPYAQLIISGLYAVDTFFLLSAFVLTMSFLSKWQKLGHFGIYEWIYYYVHRYWRLIPPYIIIIIISVQIMPYFGSGPMFSAEEFPPRKSDCENYWWSFLFFMNNFIPNGKGSQCMGYLWYIPNDYQFYALSPIFLITLFEFPQAGFALISFCMLSSLSILAFLSSNIYLSRNANIINTFIDMWDDVYIKPYNRALPYLVGILLGYLFFKHKKVKLSYTYVALGWLLSAGLALATIFGGYSNWAKDGRKMETFEYALYFSISRLTWPLSIGWIIFACHYGYGGVINTFLSSKSFLPFCRLGYVAYLIHPPLMQFYFYTMKSIFHADLVSLMYVGIGQIVVTFFFSYFYSLFFELPFYAVERLVFKQK